jgi:hypothetical protein
MVSEKKKSKSWHLDWNYNYVNVCIQKWLEKAKLKIHNEILVILNFYPFKFKPQGCQKEKNALMDRWMLFLGE